MKVTKWLPVALLAILLAITGYCLLWTTLMMYDDEGYVLYSLRTFCAVGGLYEKVYSQYGPFFYFWNWGLHGAGLEFTNQAGRALTLVYWFIAAGACARITARLTQSAVATAAVLAGVFLHLWPMVSEPSHPGGLICAVVAVVAWLGTHDRFTPATRAAWIGAAGAALVLTKINVGVFLLAGTGAWWLLASAPPAGRNRWQLGVAGALLLLPVLVMQRLLFEEWVWIFALVTATSAAAVVFAWPAKSGAREQLRHLWWGAAAGIAVTGLTVIFMRLTGTSWSSLVEGVFLGPLRHPTVYAGPVRWRFGAAVLAPLSLLLVAWLARWPCERRLPYVVTGRLLAAGAYLLCWANVLPLDLHAFALSYALAAIAWFVLPLREDDATVGTRAWLALLAVTQPLHAFPVAGSQISWGTFLWVPLAAIGVHDALQALAARQPRWRQTPVRFIVPGVVAALVLITSVRYAHMAVHRLRGSDALGLPGASNLYLPENYTSMLRILSRNAAVHADPLFSLPGMLSFHGWTEVPPPTTLNTTHWFTLLHPDQQEAIRQRLAASPRACVIVQRSVYDFLIGKHIATESPLTQWLHANFTPAFAIETYEFWVRNGRTIAALGTAQIREAESSSSPRYKLSVILAQPNLRNVTQVTLGQLDGDLSHVRLVWDRHNATIRITPINSAGNPRGPDAAAAWPFSAPELVKIELFTDVLPDHFRPGISIVHFRDATGQALAEARFVN